MNLAVQTKGAAGSTDSQTAAHNTYILFARLFSAGTIISIAKDLCQQKAFQIVVMSLQCCKTDLTKISVYVRAPVIYVLADFVR